MSDLISKVRRDFEDKEYRHAYLDEFLNAWIATQIKVLREQRGWSQKELAEYAEMLQPRISALENVNYSSWSVKTLRRLAEAFDLTLRISFESFGNRIKDFSLFDRDYLQRPSFDHDPVFSVSEERTRTESKVLAEGYEPKVVLDLSAAKKALPEAVEGKSPIAQFTMPERHEWRALEHGTAIDQPRTVNLAYAAS